MPTIPRYFPTPDVRKALRVLVIGYMAPGMDCLYSIDDCRLRLASSNSLTSGWLSRMAMRSIMALVSALVSMGSLYSMERFASRMMPLRTSRRVRPSVSSRNKRRKLSQVRQLRRLIGEEHHEQEHCDCVHSLSESSSGPDDHFDGRTRAVVRLYNATRRHSTIGYSAG